MAFDSNRVLDSYVGSQHKSRKIVAPFSPCWHPLSTAGERECYNCSLPHMYPRATVKQGHLIFLHNSLLHVVALLCCIASIKFQWAVVLFLFFLMCSMSVSSGNLEYLKFKMLCLLLLYYYANGLWSWRGERNMWQFFFPVTQSGTSPPLRVSHTPPEQLEWARLPIVALVETFHKPK